MIYKLMSTYYTILQYLQDRKQNGDNNKNYKNYLEILVHHAVR